MLGILLLSLSQPIASAAEPSTGVGIGLRVIGESWADSSIGTVYQKSGGILTGLAMNAPITGPLSIEVEAAFIRLDADPQDPSSPETRLLPTTVLLEWRLGDPSLTVQGYLGLGPSLAIYSDINGQVGANGRSGIGGAIFSAEARAGLRINTGLIRPPMPPQTSVIQRVDIEVFTGVRLQKNPNKACTDPLGCGLNLSAGRIGAGIGLRF